MKTNKFSYRAKQYFSSLKRYEEYVVDEYLVNTYLQKQTDVSMMEFLRFQIQYSGYELTIKNEPGHTFKAFLLLKQQIEQNQPSEFEWFDDRLVEICGDHASAQFNFFLTHKGEICTLDNNDEINIIHSSFEKMVEEYALRNELSDWVSISYYDVMDVSKLNRFLKNQLQIISECTDEYSTWWKNDEIAAVKGKWLDRQAFYFHVYGKKQRGCDDFIMNCKTLALIN